MNPSESSTKDVDMDLEGEVGFAIAEPPAHLNARFYRRSSARRKSSANSSRRSSLSSIHSHSSARSCHGGPRSTHIAQHLRRASIIESRKARLADRAAHAEQVRLRAAAVKAAQRVSHSEEKTLAAQAAREKLLAEVAARCEEEVKRAKKIAEEIKERRAVEMAKLREIMAEKHAEAERRRTVYQQGSRRPRTASLAVVEERKVTPATLNQPSRLYAVKIIQRSWRHYRTRKIFRDFSDLNLDLKRAKTRSFEDLTQFISDQETTQATSAVLRHLEMLDTPQDEPAIVRVFLSAYLILAHPVQTFSHGGDQPQEQELISKGNCLIATFESCVAACIAAPRVSSSSLARDAFSFAFNDFRSSFDAWKSQDLGVLVDVMVNSFVNLDLIIQTTKNDHEGHVAEDYLDAVRHEQLKLLVRLKRLAGPEEALSRVHAAVKKARKQRATEKKHKRTEQAPRASTPDVSSSQVALLTPPATPRPGQHQVVTVPVTADRLHQVMTVLPSNREIAHEIMLDGTFEIEQLPWTQARKELLDALRRSMRDSMQSGNIDPSARWTYSMAVLLREKLMKLLSPRHPLHDKVDGLLDPTLITQQYRNGMFSYDAFFGTLAGLLTQICSPGRDEIVAAFAADTSTDSIDRLFELINIVDLMTLDHINFQFRLASQAVLENGHAHESASFDRDVENGVHGLQLTGRWWQNAKLAIATPRPNGHSIYARALVDLVSRNSHLSYADLPETLQLDYVRLLRLKARIFQMITIASILLTTKLRLRRNRESLWAQDAERLMALDLVATDATRIVTIVESSHMMPTTIKEGLSNFVGRVLPPAVVAARNARTADQVRHEAHQSQSARFVHETEAGDVFNEQIASFLLKSLREHLFSRLSSASTSERVRTTTGAAEVLARAGMPEFVSEVNGIYDALDKIRIVDLKSHEKYYDQVATDTT